MVAIPSFCHRFKSSVLEMDIGVSRNLVITILPLWLWLNPRLFYLKVMGEINNSPLGIIKKDFLSVSNFSIMETPPEVQVVYNSWLRHQHYRYGEG